MNQLTAQTADKLVEKVYRAIDNRIPMTLVYHKADGSVTARTVEPYGLELSAEGHAYMLTMDRKRNAPRAYRLDRITAWTLHRKGEDVIPNPYV